MITTALTPSEREVLARAVSRAPSVHNTQPWRLRIRESDVDLIERTDLAVPGHDPDGRDRLLSCGAALAHVELALAVLGRTVTTVRAAEGPLVATVHIGRGQRPTYTGLARYRAIGRRHSHRARFSADPVGEADFAAVTAAAELPGTYVAEPCDLMALAELMGFATRVYRADAAYQRELAVWTAHTEGSTAVGDGIPEAAFGTGPPPYAGLVRRDTPVPDDARLAAWLAAERLVLLCTHTDARPDVVGAGIALERAWLEATARGLAGSVLTQPLHLAGVRDALVERLRLPGLPQVILRFGRPELPSPPSPRRPPGELIIDDSWGGPA
ncbi:Acg family FMN-binding oxidoreductase [Amycolatopsis panacis]|uniref:Nitroreductase n=1 Tax=Amycolatopsis panacis TaxID=2340917 RepID=A0A419I6Q0_9PSEU|nr:nitroreductase family protein [Amycolatopsis panacis]RJQ87246.1 nitroreductase [Amycolatopsis panacis]